MYMPFSQCLPRRSAKSSLQGGLQEYRRLLSPQQDKGPAVSLGRRIVKPFRKIHHSQLI